MKWSKLDLKCIFIGNTKFIRKFVFFRRSSIEQRIQTGWVRWMQTFSITHLCKCSTRLRKTVVRTQKEIGTALYHDKAASNTALCVCGFLAKHILATLPKQPYSLELPLSDFFPRFKTALKRSSFSNIKTIQTAVTMAVSKILAFLPERLPRCVPCTEKSLAKVCECPRILHLNCIIGRGI